MRRGIESDFPVDLLRIPCIHWVNLEMDWVNLSASNSRPIRVQFKEERACSEGISLSIARSTAQVNHHAIDFESALISLE